MSEPTRTIKPDLPAPDQGDLAGPHPPTKTEKEQDLEFLQRCFREALSGEIENWPVETFKQYFATLKRFADLLEFHGQMPAPNLSYGERLAGMAIMELSKKISASCKGRHLMDKLQDGGRKH